MFTCYPADSRASLLSTEVRLFLEACSGTPDRFELDMLRGTSVTRITLPATVDSSLLLFT